MRIFKLLIFYCVLFLPNLAVFAAPSIALGYTPKYPSNFKHFDYVNPVAPKGGELILNGNGNFDSFNNFALSKNWKADQGIWTPKKDYLLGTGDEEIHLQLTEPLPFLQYLQAESDKRLSPKRMPPERGSPQVSRP